MKKVKEMIGKALGYFKKKPEMPPGQAKKDKPSPLKELKCRM
jgi:hypothetical protein